MLLTMRERMPGGSGRGERAETSMWTMAALTGLWASAKPPIVAAEAVKNSPLRERLGAASTNFSALRLGLDCSDTFASSAPTSRDDLSKKTLRCTPLAAWVSLRLTSVMRKGTMTAFGTKRTFYACRRMSVLGGKAVVQRTSLSEAREVSGSETARVDLAAYRRHGFRTDAERQLTDGRRYAVHTHRSDRSGGNVARPLISKGDISRCD